MSTTTSVGGVRSPDAPTVFLEAPLRALLAPVGLHPDLLVGSVGNADAMAGEPDLSAIHARCRIARRDVERGWLGRMIVLDAYGVDMLLDDARRAGPGARVDVRVDWRTSASAVEALRRRLAPLVRHGVRVRLARDPSPRDMTSTGRS